MKKLVVAIVSLMVSVSAMAYDTAKLKMRISGPTHSNAYFLCVSNVGGCVSILASKLGKVYPMDVGNVKHIFMANTANMRIFNQSVPKSCNVNIAKNKTLTVSGHISVQNNGNAKINNLRCTVT